jgi:uncharacterized protein involved in exopolysaccharide biosynthesis
MRLARTDAALDALHEERDHLAIQISLLNDSATPDPPRLSALRQQLKALEHRIAQYRPADA